MTLYSPADRLHRLVKEALDSGAAESLEAAEALFRGYRLAICIESHAAQDRHHQAALLTVVNLARRVFLGGVEVEGDLDQPLVLQMPLGQTLREAVERLGGAVASEGGSSIPMIRIGGAPRARGGRFEVRTVWSGWRGGAVPAHAELEANAPDAMPLSPMLAAALAVSEAFFHVRGGAPEAGRRPALLSLWRPGLADPFAAADDGPALQRLPDRLWLIGLGHLGQAYLWALGLLPYTDPTRLELVLQDMDRITPSTESTSILTDADMVGEMKTRAMARWCEARGFSARIVERFFDPAFQRRADEPGVALCGLDNALGRRALDKVEFEFVVEAGLGRGARDFQTLRLHTLPGTRGADELWGPDTAGDEGTTDRPAYKRLLSEGSLDQCGVTLLAGKAVGAPFVGAVAAPLVVSELLRLLHGGPVHELVDLNLTALRHQQAVEAGRDFSGFNPGFVDLNDT